MLSNEIENALHTLKDIVQSQQLISYNIKRCMQIHIRLGDRIEGLEQRLDRIAQEEISIKQKRRKG